MKDTRFMFGSMSYYLMIESATFLFAISPEVDIIILLPTQPLSSKPLVNFAVAKADPHRCLAARDGLAYATLN